MAIAEGEEEDGEETKVGRDEEEGRAMVTVTWTIVVEVDVVVWSSVVVLSTDPPEAVGWVLTMGVEMGLLVFGASVGAMVGAVVGVVVS